MFKFFYIFLAITIYFSMIYVTYFLRINNHELDWIFIAILSLFFVFFLYKALDKGGDKDNKRLIEKLKSNNQVIVSHKGTIKDIDAIINNKKLIPHDVKIDGPVQRILRKKNLRKIDHDKDAIWVFLGTPQNTFDFMQGVLNPWKWKKAITFEVPANIIETPKGVTRKMFGKHQLVITRPVVLSGDEKIFIKEGIRWRESPTRK